MFDWVQDVPLDTTQYLKFKQGHLQAVSKDGIIFINFLDLKFRALNCLSISQPLKQLSDLFVQWSSQKHLFGKFSEIIIKTSVVEFILSKVPYFSERL